MLNLPYLEKNMHVPKKEGHCMGTFCHGRVYRCTPWLTRYTWLCVMSFIAGLSGRSISASIAAAGRQSIVVFALATVLITTLFHRKLHIENYARPHTENFLQDGRLRTKRSKGRWL